MAGSRAVLVRSRCKTGVVAARYGALAHFPREFTTAFGPGGETRFCAKFLCGGTTSQAVILSGTGDARTVCAACEDAAKGPGVYRCLNAGRQPVYIGSAVVVLKRLSAHESRSPWWPEVADVKVERFPTIFQARAAERLAIKAEMPLHNEQYKKSA